MKKISKIAVITMFFLAACDKDKSVPEGYEIVSNDGGTHFVYVSPDNVGDNVSQREAARKICKVIYEKDNYCEIYFFDNKEQIPQKFPIINRVKPIGTYELKDGKEKFSALK